MKVSTIAIVLCATVCFNSLTAQATQISYHVAVDKETTGQDLTKMQKNNPAVTNIDEAPVSSPGAKRLLVFTTKNAPPAAVRRCGCVLPAIIYHCVVSL